MSFKGKNAVITGSTSGIGLAIAHSLAAQGCNITVNGMGDKAIINDIIHEFTDKYGVKAFYSSADMAKPIEIRKMITDTEKKFGSVDFLINNAGIQFTAPVDEFPDNKWDAIIAINLSAVFHSTKTTLPGMRKRNFGRIINIASVHGLVASPHKAAYVAAKHGIIGLTKVTALETAEVNITANAICPGWVHTPLVQKQIEDMAKKRCITTEKATKELLGEKQPNKRFITPESIGAIIVFLCGEYGSSVTGSSFVIDGGWTAE